MVGKIETNCCLPPTFVNVMTTLEIARHFHIAGRHAHEEPDATCAVAPSGVLASCKGSVVPREIMYGMKQLVSANALIMAKRVRRLKSPVLRDLNPMPNNADQRRTQVL